MAEVLSNDDMSHALEQFFGSKVSIYEAGADEDRPKEFLDRPFVKLLPGNKTYFIESLNHLKGDGSYSLAINEALQDGSLDTKATKTFKAIEERFNKVKSDQKLFVIDADSIRSRYALDEADDRSLAKSIVQYVREKKEKYGIEENFPASRENTSQLIDSAFKATSAFSRTQFGNVTEDNLKGDFSVSLIVVQNPDDLQKKWMVSVPGVPERMAKEGLSHDNLCRFTIYHEFGHALDELSNRGMVPYLIEADPEQVMTRYHKECFADAHAVLQMARDDRNTKAGELLSDIRIKNIIKAVTFKGKQGIEDTKPELEKRLEKMERQQALPKDENKEGKTIRKLQKYDEKYERISEIGRHMAYYTTPVVDAAVAFAKKGLKDGSLLAMSDEEVLKACRKLVNENTLSNDRMSSLRMAILTGKEDNPDLETIRARDVVANKNLTIDQASSDKKVEETKKILREKRETQLKSLLGIIDDKNDENSSEDSKSAKEAALLKRSLIDWNDKLIAKIEKCDYSKEGILKIVKEEKDVLRDYHGRAPDKLREAKLQLLNNSLLSQPDTYIAKAQTRATVRDTISSSKTVTVKGKTGQELVDEYFKYKRASTVYASASVESAGKLDLSKTSPQDFLKAKNQEAVNYNKTMVAEKTAQEIAFAICKDKDAITGLKQKNPTIAKLIEASAKRRHPDWLEEYHMSFGSTDKKTQKETVKTIKKYANILKKSADEVKPKTKKTVANTIVAKKLQQGRR